MGGQRTIRINARIISATNKDLKAAVAAGRFRQDLFYRLNTFTIELPELRELYRGLGRQLLELDLAPGQETRQRLRELLGKAS